MKLIVSSKPDSPSKCLFLKDYYKETCKFGGAVCVFSSQLNTSKDKRIYPYLIELKELNK